MFIVKIRSNSSIFHFYYIIPRLSNLKPTESPASAPSFYPDTAFVLSATAVLLLLSMPIQPLYNFIIAWYNSPLVLIVRSRLHARYRFRSSPVSPLSSPDSAFDLTKTDLLLLLSMPIQPLYNFIIAWYNSLLVLILIVRSRLHARYRFRSSPVSPLSSPDSAFDLTKTNLLLLFSIPVPPPFKLSITSALSQYYFRPRVV